MERKEFLKQSILTTLALGISRLPSDALGSSAENSPMLKRKFTMQLNGGLIGVRANQLQLIELAHQYGFETVVALPQYLEKLSDNQCAELLADMKMKKLAFGLGDAHVEFRKDEDLYRKGLAALPAKCAALQRAGVTRSMTYIVSNHSELNYLRNFRLHTVRLREIAVILKDHCIRFGLEYVGPKSIWSANKFPFIHTLDEVRELIAAIGQSNVGVHLDSAHWFTAGEKLESLRALANSDVVGCDLNDALPGITPIEDQPGYHRELPAATGVIDTKGFLEALLAIGYDGFIQAEPFNDALNKLEDGPAVEKTAEAMKKAFALLTE